MADFFGPVDEMYVNRLGLTAYGCPTGMSHDLRTVGAKILLYLNRYSLCDGHSRDA